MCTYSYIWVHVEKLFAQILPDHKNTNELDREVLVSENNVDIDSYDRYYLLLQLSITIIVINETFRSYQVFKIDI